MCESVYCEVWTVAGCGWCIAFLLPPYFLFCPEGFTHFLLSVGGNVREIDVKWRLKQSSVMRSEGEAVSLHEDQTTACSKIRDDNNKENYPHRAAELEEHASPSWSQEKKMFNSASRSPVGILQIKQSCSSVKSESGKGHEANQEAENVIPCLSDSRATKGMTSNDHTHVSMKTSTDFQARNSPVMRLQAKEGAEHFQYVGEEEVVQPHGSKDTASSLVQTVPSECANHAEPASPYLDSQSDTDHGPEDSRGVGTSRLLFHITDGDNPLLSPRCSIFTQSQRYNLDPESAPSPPSSQQFMMPRSSSRGNCEDAKEPLTVIQLTKQIQSLKRKIRKYEDKFEQEKNYRPSHSDKTSNLEVLKWMNDLAKARKQLKELKLKLSEDQNVPRTSQGSNHEDRTVSCVVDHGATSASMSSVEETVETVLKRLKENRRLLNLPENLKGTKQERSLMKPLYDRYRIIKQLLSTASLIPTIHEEEDSDEDSAQNSSEMPLADTDGTTEEQLTYSSDDLEPAYVSPLDEKRPVRQLALSMSNLHEASMPELLDQLRETRADKKRLRKALREFEEHFLRQTGRSVQKEDRIPMAEEYCEYKQLKAKLRLLEVLISKQEVSKTI
uniref:Family with sequence similarity 13 member C n=1 Tax=Leptobrachium leishanense TaxID=445787 RepID=A0A8C5MJN4_9ANUR